MKKHTYQLQSGNFSGLSVGNQFVFLSGADGKKLVNLEGIDLLASTVQPKEDLKEMFSCFAHSSWRLRDSFSEAASFNHSKTNPSSR